MKQIESYNISKSQYGVITLIINTRDRWLPFYDRICLGGHEFEVTDEKGFAEALKIQDEEFGFELEKEGRYHRLNQQEKDQIVYYFIPIRLLKSDEWAEKLFKVKIN